MTRDELIGVMIEADLTSGGLKPGCPDLGIGLREDAVIDVLAEASGRCRVILSAIESAQAGTLKRHADPKPGGCTYRTGPDCIGVRMHCKLEAGHQPLGHGFIAGRRGLGLQPRCAVPTNDAGDACGQTQAAHGRPHAMEVSGPYVLKVEGRA